MYKQSSSIHVAWVWVMAFGALMPVTVPKNGGDTREDADQLIRAVVANELKAQLQNGSLWRYQETKEQGGETQLLEIVETNQGNLRRTIKMDGQPLTRQQVSAEDARIQHFLSNPRTRQNERRKQQQDFASEQHFLGMLPDAFHFQNAGKDGILIKLNFEPNPAFHPSRREGQVFHHMEGSIWLDPVHMRIARVTGHLISEVKFGGGILGHLAKGGTFLVEQQEVSSGCWRLTHLEVNMKGKALFFKTIDVNQKLQNFNFERIAPQTTLQGAAEMLKHRPVQLTISAW